MMTIVHINDSRYEDLLQVELLWRCGDLDKYHQVVYNKMFDIEDGYYMPEDTIEFIKNNHNGDWLDEYEILDERLERE